MKVLIVDDNLMWTSRLRKSLASLGHTSEVGSAESGESCDIAIVNLSSKGVNPTESIQELRARGVRTICHAGHKEKDLLNAGRKAGCDHIATHSELTFKLGDIMKAACGEG